MESLKFEELPDGMTRVTDIVVFQTVEDRDGMYETGMKEGTDESFRRISNLLKRIKRNEKIACAA